MLPDKALFLTTPIEPLEPHALNGIVKFVQGGKVPCKSVIIVVPLKYSAQMPVQLAERHHIAQSPEFIIYVDQLGPLALADRLAAEPHTTSTAARHVMGKPKKIKCVCLVTARLILLIHLLLNTSTAKIGVIFDRGALIS